MIEPARGHRETTEKALAAFAVVAEKVIQRARQTGTKVIVWADEQVTELDPDEIRLADDSATQGPADPRGTEN